MEYLYEELVCWKITRDPFVFASRQYNIAKGYSCPDIVALDMRNRKVWVVEVSTASNADTLARKVNDREKQWFGKLREQLAALPNSLIDASWPFMVKVFIRLDAEPGFCRIVGDPLPKDVEVHLLEKIDFPWGWGLE